MIMHRTTMRIIIPVSSSLLSDDDILFTNDDILLTDIDILFLDIGSENELIIQLTTLSHSL